MEQWFVLHTKPHCERQVAMYLHQRGLDVYLPLIWVSPINPRASRERPYFPGYLFAKLDRQTLGMDILAWSPGVKGVVECGDEPMTVSDAFVAELQEWLTRVRAVGGMEHNGARRVEFLQVKEGPFEGFEGLFNARVHGADRARILLACVQEEFLRQTAEARRETGSTNHSTSRRHHGK